jgi:anthranilate/para-aminobenzoate synthase component II
VSQDAFPEELEVIATDQEGVIMGIRHRLYPITGLQFHPESYITKNGEALMQQWLRGIK